MNAGELIRALVEEIGLKEYYNKNSFKDDQDRFQNVIELIKSVDEFISRKNIRYSA